MDPTNPPEISPRIPPITPPANIPQGPAAAHNVTPAQAPPTAPAIPPTTIKAWRILFAHSRPFRIFSLTMVNEHVHIKESAVKK